VTFAVEATREATLRVVTLPVVTPREVTNSEATFRVEMFARVANSEATFRVATLAVVARREVTNSEATFKVEMFARVANSDATFRVVMLPVVTPREVTISELTFKVVTLAVETKRDATLSVVIFDRVAMTFVVVKEFETTRFTKGWLITLELIFERRPPSAVMVPGNVAAPVVLKSHVFVPTMRSIALDVVWIIPVPNVDGGRLNVPSIPYIHVYDPAPSTKGNEVVAFTVPVVTVVE
jgi:hypothetical protein